MRAALRDAVKPPPLNRRWNVDQVPIACENAYSTTYVDKDSARDSAVKVSSFTGAEKRFATLQLCVGAPGGPAPPLVIIFRGAGHVKATEKARYHPGVQVRWQQKAWADTAFCKDWAETVMVPFVREHCAGERWLLFADSLGSQRMAAFLQPLKDAGGEVFFGPPGLTDIWQPIDRGSLGRLLKQLVRAIQSEWLDRTSHQVDAAGEHLANWQLWERGLAASERRVLLTHWCAEAYQQFLGERYYTAIQKAWSKGGCDIGDANAGPLRPTCPTLSHPCLPLSHC